MVEIVCYKCNSTGMMLCPLEYASIDHPYNCPSCSGGNEVVCLVCNGEGNIDVKDDF